MDIKKSLNKALSSLHNWAETKKDESDELLKKGEDKVNQYLTKQEKLKDHKDKKITADLSIKINEKDKIIAKKGTTIRDVLNKLKKILFNFFSKLKKICKAIVDTCKEILKSIVVLEKIDLEKEREEKLKKLEEIKKIKERKEKIENFKEAAYTSITILGEVATIVATILSVRSIAKSKKESR